MEDKLTVQQGLEALFHSEIEVHVHSGKDLTPEGMDCILRLAERIDARSSVEQLRLEVKALRDSIADVATKAGLTKVFQEDGWDRPS